MRVLIQGAGALGSLLGYHLAEAGHEVTLGLRRRPDGWPEWAVRLGELANRPFGVSRAYESFRPYEAVRRHAREVAYREAVLGAVYLSVGEAPSPDGPSRQHREPYA